MPLVVATGRSFAAASQGFSVACVEPDMQTNACGSQIPPLTKLVRARSTSSISAFFDALHIWHFAAVACTLGRLKQVAQQEQHEEKAQAAENEQRLLALCHAVAAKPIPA